MLRVLDDQAINQAIATLEKINADKALSAAIWARQKQEYDYNSEMTCAEARGEARGAVNALVRALNKRIGEIPENIRVAINGLTDTALLNEAFDLALSAVSYEQFSRDLERLTAR